MNRPLMTTRTLQAYRDLELVQKQFDADLRAVTTQQKAECDSRLVAGLQHAMRAFLESFDESPLR